jgi:hypothetical protein
VSKNSELEAVLRLTSFEDAEEETNSCDSPKGMYAAEAHSYSTPREHEKRNPFAGTEFLQKVVGRDFENSVRNQEDHQGDAAVC